MTYKNDKLRDLTPLITTFVPGESPTAEKLQGMIRQADAAIEYLENKVGDLAGEEGVFNTWVSTLARNIGDFSKLNPSILPNFEVLNYNQPLVAGAVEHELDMIPVGPLDDLIASTLDSCIVISQYKNTIKLLEKPGDWTIEFSYIENGKIKRGRKLVTHSPSEGGSVVFKRVTSGRGSSLEGSSENTIPSIAQAEDGGPFLDVEVIDSAAKIYQITLPARTKMYDKLGSIVNFSASNSQSAIGLNSQYELPKFFFGLDGLDLDTDDEDGFPKQIPLNLITLYNWETKREVEGIIFLQAVTTASARKTQFILQTKQDVILNTATGKYVVVVAGNSVANQLKGLADTVYGNTGVGNDMTRLISHKNMMDLRTSSLDFSNRSAYYGPSIINNNDHSMYFHRDGFTDADKGAGGNILRGHVVVGSTSTGLSDLIHENFNIDSDSYGLHFGNIANGPEIKYAKAKTYTIDHSYGGLPIGIVDSGLWIQGAVSDLDSARKNIFLEGDIRTSGNIILGKSASDIIFLQGKTYVNDEITFIPRTTVGLVGEEGKSIYSSTEKAPIFFNGSQWISPWNFSGFTTTIGDGVTSFGKHNGSNVTPFTSALAEVALGGSIKVLPGTYNLLGNKISIPANVTIEGSGQRTVIKGTGILVETTGVNAVAKNFKVQDGSVGIKLNADGSIVDGITHASLGTAIEITQLGTNACILENNKYISCAKTVSYTGTIPIDTLQTVAKNAITHSGSTVNDWSLKEEVLKDYVIDSGTAVLTLDQTLDSSVGKGAFKVTGSGTLISKKMLPVNVNVGIGGHINIKRTGTTGTVSVGVTCYGKDYNNLGIVNFILNLADPLTAPLDDSFHKNILLGTTGFVGMMFPAGTRFVKPTITISSNNGDIVFDGFEVFSMSYARFSSWA